MKMLWIIIFLLACFGIVGRIDYESELAMANNRIEEQTIAARSQSEDAK